MHTVALTLSRWVKRKMRSSDLKFMRRALFLAENRARYVSPNPRVGAVLVRNGKVVGEGATQPYGGAHAEAVALRKAGPRAKGATLYVTLEPCSHFGKTPPCADALVKAGVGKVVAAMGDPFPLVRGRGFGKLRRAGIPVKVGLLEKEALLLNPFFFRSLKLGRPWVILKAAVSLDGKMAPPAGGPRWITGRKARLRAHEIRSHADAILVGSGTAAADNPSLTVRLPGFRRRDGWPLRVVLDSKLKTGWDRKLFRGPAKTVLFTAPDASRAREKALKRKGILVFRVPLFKKMLSLRAILKRLDSLQVRTLLVEGGGKIHASFLEQNLVDGVELFLSPARLGPKAVAWMGERGLEKIVCFPWEGRPRFEKIGADFLLSGRKRG